MSAPVSPTLPTHRSALPPLPPPAYSASPSSGSRSLASHIATEGSSRHPHYQVELASSSGLRLGHQEAGTMSRPPIPRRISSSSDPSHRSSSSSSANRSADPSTAPTSPSGFNTSMHRTWRPTSNVPLAVANRHRSAATADREERNRWLSEDEGLGASSSGTTRRRRRRRRSSREDEDNDDRDNDDDHHDHGSDVDDDRHGGGGGGAISPASDGPGPGTSQTRLAQEKAGLLSTPSSKPLRPKPRRVKSFEPSRSSSLVRSIPIGAADVTVEQASGVGANPPRIQDIMPGPAPPPRLLGLGLASGVSADRSEHQDQSHLGITTVNSMLGSVPDFAQGRGGDGIGGFGVPSASSKPILSAKQQQLDMLHKLKRVLGCALCPHKEGQTPSLHHPITLPCGHTLSAEHITIPSPAPLQLDPSKPEHEVFAAQSRQHQLRLNLWAGVMCPIPGCKRYSASASTSPYVPSSLEMSDWSSSSSSRPGRSSRTTIRGETLSSGVTYYPPAQPAPPAYSAEAPVNENGMTPLFDITVDKILHIVTVELARLTAEDEVTQVGSNKGDNTDATETDDTGLETETDQDDDADLGAASHTTLTSDLSALGGFGPEITTRPTLHASSSGQTRVSELSHEAPPAPLTRKGSKRRRNHLRSPTATRSHMDSLGRVAKSRSGSPSWPFQKELLGLLDCDVCAMMLYEPVTTPCQHTFCAKCLSRSLDHSSRCPLCRQDLPSFAFYQDHSVNRVLLTVLKTAFADDYVERQRTIERDEKDAKLDTPIFVCTLAFPGMPTILHVFEPRYRLMIRRCIDSSNPQFGMVLPSRAPGPGETGTEGVMEYGTMLEIQSVQMLPDGRSMVETVGTHRFRLLERGSLDGYTVGRIERIDDITPEEEIALEQEAVDRAALSRAVSRPVHHGNSLPQQIMLPGGNSIPAPTSSAMDDTVQTTEEYMNICRAFIEQLRSGSAPWLLQRLNNTYGTMPTDPSEFSYWMALVMPIDEYEKARLLPIRSPRLRLKLIVHWIESLRSSWWFSSG